MNASGLWATFSRDPVSEKYTQEVKLYFRFCHLDFEAEYFIFITHLNLNVNTKSVRQITRTLNIADY